MQPLYSLAHPLVRAQVVARPSSKNKSPYLLDAVLEDDSKEVVICHSASLGCSGAIVKGSYIWIFKKINHTGLSTYEVYLVEHDNTTICVHPLVANKIAYQLLKRDYVLKDITNVVPEVGVDECRFDFIGQYNSKMAIIEVKNVPLADYEDISAKEKKKFIASGGSYESKSKISIFPYDGKRRTVKEPISERALKHVETLHRNCYSSTCVLLFVIQRTDVESFCITKLDPVYLNAAKAALDAGVLIKAICIRWDNQHAYYEKEVPVVW